HTVPAPFWAGVLMPGAFFALLYLWPFIERRFTHDGEPHQLLDHPSDASWRTGIGAAVLTFAVVLTFAGSDDVASTLLSISVERLVTIFQWLVFILPVVVGFLTYQVAREVHARRETLHPREPRVVYSRDEAGGFVEQPESVAERES
ncbi:MAG: hypothetical protein GIW95_06120, partial [Candidatus Eremiobacteraeota bacterium]|nr:hypothetical protein [Candidatus Eremiobacteraeota bacterium]